MEIDNLVIEKYEWGDKILTVRENKIIHKKLQSDPDFASRYFTKFVGPKKVDDEAKISSDEEIDEDHIWSSDAVKLLVREYKSRINRFNNPRVKNSLLWREIAEVFKKKNKPYPVQSINRKFHNMKMTYYRVTKKKQRIKVGRRPWPWIKAMEEILGKYDSNDFSNHVTISDKKDDNIDDKIIQNESASEPSKSSSVDTIEDNLDMIDDTSNLSSSLRISSDHDCNSNNSQNLQKNISDYEQLMLDLKREQVEILKLIHKDLYNTHYSSMEVFNELAISIKEHTLIFKEFTDILKEKLSNK